MSHLKLVSPKEPFSADYQPLRRTTQNSAPSITFVPTESACPVEQVDADWQPYPDEPVVNAMLTRLIQLDRFLNTICQRLIEHGWQPLLFAYFLVSVPVMDVVAILCVQKII